MASISTTLKQKKVAIPLIIVLLLGGYVLASGGANDVTNEKTAVLKTVTTMDPAAIASSTQYIEANGTVETLESVDLASEVSARVARVNVSLGDEVRRGQTLVVYNNADLAASRAGAEADLESARANKKSIEAQYAAQEAALARTITSGENAVAAAESALRTAENNLRQSTTIGDTQVVRDAYADMVPLLKGMQDSLQTVLTTVDNILGIDNEFANDEFENILSVQNLSALNKAEQQYVAAKQSKTSVDTVLIGLSIGSNAETIDTAITQVANALDSYRTLLLSMTEVLEATPPIGDLSQTELDGLKNNIQNARGIIVGHSTSLTNQQQAIDTAKNSFDSLQIAYDKAVRDLAAAQKNLAADKDAGEAQLNQISASLELQDANIKSAAARVAGIGASIAKTVITAPISGTIASLPATVGELMSPGQLAVRIVNTGSYQVKTYITADDVALVSKGNAAVVANTYEAIVTNVSPGIDPSTNKVEVIVLVTSENPTLVSDQFVSVSIEQTPSLDTTFTRIPLEAVRLTSAGATVLVVNSESVLEARTITIGQVVGSNIEADIRDITLPIVTSVRGLEAGESVTISAQ